MCEAYGDLLKEHGRNGTLLVYNHLKTSFVATVALNALVSLYFWTTAEYELIL